MELHVWPADFGLPSIDVNCLQFLACSKMCASPVTVISSMSPWDSPNGEYPVFFVKSKGDKSITDFDKFVDVLRKSGQDVVIDADLTADERAHIDAFGCFLQQYLHPAVLHTMWGDELNYSTITQYWYTTRLPFPYNMYYLEKKKKRINRFLRDKNVSTIIKDALQALNMLSAKLGDSKFFCGNKPSSLDALVFGYLAPLLRFPLVNDRLQLHLKACPNLARFVESVTSIYLPLSDDQLRQQKSERRMWDLRLHKAEHSKETDKSASTETTQQSHEEMPIRDSILFGLGAITLSILFAVHSGIIQVVVEDDEQVLAD